MTKMYFSYISVFCLPISGSQLLTPLGFPVIRAIGSFVMLMRGLLETAQVTEG